MEMTIFNKTILYFTFIMLSSHLFKSHFSFINLNTVKIKPFKKKYISTKMFNCIFFLQIQLCSPNKTSNNTLITYVCLSERCIHVSIFLMPVHNYCCLYFHKQNERDNNVFAQVVEINGK